MLTRHSAAPLKGRRFAFTAATLAAVLVAATWIATWQRARYESEQTVESALRAHANMTVALEQNAAAAFCDVEDMLEIAASAFRDSAGRPKVDIVNQWRLHRDLITGVAIVGADGRLVLASGDANVDAAAYGFHRAHPGTDLRIGRAESTNPGQWRVPTSRRMERADGSFEGIVIATIDPAHFTNFYRRTNLGDAGVRVLINKEGFALARYEGGLSSFDVDMRRGTLWKIRTAQPSGSFLSAGSHDGTRRLMSYRTLPDYGLIVQVGAAEADVMSPVRERLRLYYLIAALVSGAIVLIAFGTTRAVVAQTRALERLAASDAQLRASETRMRIITESMAGAVITTDIAGAIHGVNPAACRMFGYGRAEMLRLTIADLVHPSRQRALGALLADMSGRKGDFVDPPVESVSVRKDGSSFEVEVLVSCVTLDQERVYIGIVHDISQSKRMERELRASEARLRANFDQAIIGICDTSLDGCFTRANSALCDMLGYAEAELVGKSFAAVTHPDDLERSRALLAVLPAHSAGGPGRPITKRYVRKDGSVLWALVSVSVIRNDDGTPAHFSSMIQDITEMKRAERLKSEFVSTVSHELRTPLTSINGSLGLMAAGIAGALPSAAAELVAIAARNCERLVRLVNDILDTEKLDSGNVRFDVRVQDLRPLAAHVVQANEGFARDKGAALLLRQPAEALPAEVDSDRFNQVLTNLISNAVKYSPPGKAVEIVLEHDGDCAHVAVRDEGPGIPADFQPHLFERFCQADSSDSRAKSGSGLGLHIAKTIVERLHGRIDFDTTPGAGTTFHVRIPLAEARRPIDEILIPAEA